MGTAPGGASAAADLRKDSEDIRTYTACNVTAKPRQCCKAQGLHASGSAWTWPSYHGVAISLVFIRTSTKTELQIPNS